MMMMIVDDDDNALAVKLAWENSNTAFAVYPKQVPCVHKNFWVLPSCKLSSYVHANYIRQEEHHSSLETKGQLL